MAVVNHSTLRQSAWGQERLGDLPVLHIGAPNPWPRYLRHGLGQPNHLLSFPGFEAENQPSAAGPDHTIDGGLDSQYFGRCVEEQLNGLGRSPDVKVISWWVALIQARAAQGQGPDARIVNEEGGVEVFRKIRAGIADRWRRDDAPYRLCVYDPRGKECRWVYAAYIDICTGPGRPKVDPPERGHSRETQLARTPPWLPPEIWSRDQDWLNRRTLNGVDAIRDEVRWARGDRICVTAGGGVGLNAAEKARNNECRLDWFGRSGLMPIFENPRNLTFLMNPGTGERCEPGKRRDVGINNEADLLPLRPDHRLGMGAILDQVVDSADDPTVQVTLIQYVAAPDRPRVAAATIRDHFRQTSNLHRDGYWEFSPEYSAEVAPLVASIRYDRLVVPNGQETDDVGQPRSFARHLTFTPVAGDDGRMICLETADRCVRILGAASNNYPGFDLGTWNGARRPGDTAEGRMWHFHATLAVSAVPDGFIICGVNTAAANHYFEDFPNRNVNTMTYDEILAVVGEEDLARAIVENRKDNNGYLDLEDLRRVTGSDADVLSEFRYSY
jgi:hypothetical protein